MTFSRLQWSILTNLQMMQTLANGGGDHCAMALPSDPKNKKCMNSFWQCILSVFGIVYQMFNFRWITLFCLEKRLSKHKMTIFSTNLGGGMAPLALPWLRLCFGPPLGRGRHWMQRCLEDKVINHFKQNCKLRRKNFTSSEFFQILRTSLGI